MTMVNEVTNQLLASTQTDKKWAAVRPHIIDESTGLHIAVMREPFLSLLLSGTKTVESRFSTHAIAPFGKMTAGDIIFLKAGPLVGMFEAAWATSTELRPGVLGAIQRQHGSAICADEAFWRKAKEKRYVTLIGVKNVRALPPLKITKRDMRGWVTLRAAQ